MSMGIRVNDVVVSVEMAEEDRKALERIIHRLTEPGATEAVLAALGEPVREGSSLVGTVRRCMRRELKAMAAMLHDRIRYRAMQRAGAVTELACLPADEGEP